MDNTKQQALTSWNIIKYQTHARNSIKPIKEGEIWWCSTGENVGVKINGKGHLFSRPILVFKKLSRYGFIGIPLTSQSHSGSWYVPFRFQNKNQVAVLAQQRSISVLRLQERMGTIDEEDFQKIKNGMYSLLFQ